MTALRRFMQKTKCPGAIDQEIDYPIVLMTFQGIRSTWIGSGYRSLYLEITCSNYGSLNDDTGRIFIRKL